jgi:putative lipase involved disintegration of autophagic bodies
MCFLNTYSCTMTCLNTEFPTGQEITTAAISNLTEIQQHACKMTCTLTEHYSEGGASIGGISSPLVMAVILVMFVAAVTLFYVWTVHRE